jgi:hypothetical protein
VVGPDIRIAVDANQRWDVGTAVSWMTALAPSQPWWIEEPTSPDDVLGHAAIRAALTTATPDGGPIRVATGEHVANRIVFKQLLQASAIDIVQLDACRVGGVNENIAILLLAAKFGVPVCPHAGGVGLCEIVQHLSMFDYVALSGTTHGRRLEWIDHLHEHFAAPAVVTGGRYRAPRAPRASNVILPESLAECSYHPALRGTAGFLTADVGPLIFGLSRLADLRSADPTRGQQGRGSSLDAGRHLGRGDPSRRHRAALLGRAKGIESSGTADRDQEISRVRSMVMAAVYAGAGTVVTGVASGALGIGLRSSRRSQDTGKSASRRPATRSAAVSISLNLPSRSTAAIAAATAE